MRKTTAALLLAVSLAGCAAPADPAPVSSAPAPEIPPVSAEHMRSALVESAARPLSESEILDAYHQAQRVYGWFDLAPLPTSGETVRENGAVFYRVDMDGIEELEDLRAYLRGVFSQELAEALLGGEASRIRYQDIGGALYFSGSSRDRENGKGAVHVEAEQLEETAYSVNVMVDLLAEDGETVVGLESWSFPYAFSEGRWVFTDFQLVY